MTANVYRYDELHEFRVLDLQIEMNVYVHRSLFFFFYQKAGINVIKVLHLYVTRVAFVSLAENKENYITRKVSGLSRNEPVSIVVPVFICSQNPQNKRRKLTIHNGSSSRAHTDQPHGIGR